MAKDSAFLCCDIESNCTESFHEDVNIVVGRRVNFILEKTKTNIKNQRIELEIKEVEKNLEKITPIKEHENLMTSVNDITDLYWNLIIQHIEDAYKQGFKDSMQLMFATNN